MVTNGSPLAAIFLTLLEGLNRLVRESPNDALSVIQFINTGIAEKNDYELLSNLAAGPLEDLLVRNGSKVIDRIEVIAKEDSEFRKCLGGVWQNAMSDELFERVQKYADHSWDVT